MWGRSMPVMVSLRQVAKQYMRGKEAVHVLNALDLDIDSGEFVALSGPSGSGKTTLLNIIGGLSRADAGEVTVAGERVHAMTSNELAHWRSRHIGFVFQFYNLLPMLSAARNVEVPLLLTDLSRYQRRRNVQAALELVGLSDRATHKPAELSGGQQQRVAIARALVADPSLLVCDEPTGDLDRKTADEVLNLLRTLQQQGKTVVMVTHDPLAAAFASRRVFMDKGRLEAERQAA